MQRFTRMNSLRKLTSAHPSVHNHFNLRRDLVDRQTYKIRRLTVIAEWPSPMA